jgi:hypothetical protein
MKASPLQSQLTQTPYEKYRPLLATFLATFLALILIPHGIYNNPDFGLDPSWGIAINLAVKNKLVFGKDFVFTYGPLGILQTRLSIGVPEITYLLFDAFVLVNFGFAFFTILKKWNMFFSFVVIILSIWLLNREPAMMLLWLVLFYLFEYLTVRNEIILVNLILLAVISFFLKLSTGFIPPVFAALAIIYGLRARMITFKAAATIVVLYIVLVVIVAFLLNVDLIAYVRESLRIINGYNDAMYVRRENADMVNFLEWALACVVVFVLTGLIYIRRVFKNEFLLLLFACSSIFLFVLFKASFTRFHYYGFFSFVTPFYGVVLLNVTKEMRRFAYGGLTFCLAVSVFTVGSIDKADILLPTNTVKSLAREINLYYKLALNYPGDSPEYSTYPDYFKVPAGMTDSIGQSSVDILPCDIAVLTAKGMNYTGRPVIQSYCVFDGKLDKLNADYYASSEGPKYLLFKSEEIDARYGMFSETLLKLEILKHYTTIDRSWHHILLKRLTTPLTSTVVKTDSGSVNIKQRIELGTGDELQVAYVDVEYSFLGKIRRFFYQPPDLSVTLYLEGDMQASFKCIQTNARDGLIVNRFVPNSDPEELALFVNSNGTLSKRVKSIRFHSNFPEGFKSTINYRIEHHKFEGQAKDVHDWDPQVFASAGISKDSVVAAIDILTASPQRVEVVGWAFNKSKPAAKFSTYVAIGRPDSLLAFKSGSKLYRPDVAGIFKLKNDSTGFKVTIPGNFVMHETEELRLLLVDEKGIIASAKFDRKIEFDSIGTKMTNSGMGEIQQLQLPPVSDWMANKVEFNFDVFDEDEDYLHVTGWAFPKEIVSTPEKPFTIYISFEKGDERRIFKTIPSSRPDVSEYFKNNALDRSGLDFEIDKSKLAEGQWKLVLIIEFEGKVYTGSTDNIINVETKGRMK